MLYTFYPTLFVVYRDLTTNICNYFTVIRRVKCTQIFVSFLSNLSFQSYYWVANEILLQIMGDTSHVSNFQLWIEILEVQRIWQLFSWTTKNQWNVNRRNLWALLFGLALNKGPTWGCPINKGPTCFWPDLESGQTGFFEIYSLTAPHTMNSSERLLLDINIKQKCRLVI